MNHAQVEHVVISERGSGVIDNKPGGSFIIGTHLAAQTPAYRKPVMSRAW
jgi:hypothetical protein